MTLLAPPPAPLLRPSPNFVLDDVTWDYYSRTLKERDDRGLHVRITYDRGRMEFMTNSDVHERVKTIIARLLEVYSLERNVPILGLGSLTCRREDIDRGVEPDECYYVTTRLSRPLKNERLDLNVDPPPDLAVEVDITRSSIPRQPIYGALGVPEIWRFDGERVRVLHRQVDGTYTESVQSKLFPDLPLVEFNRFLSLAIAAGLDVAAQHEAFRGFRAYLIATK